MKAIGSTARGSAAAAASTTALAAAGADERYRRRWQRCLPDSVRISKRSARRKRFPSTVRADAELGVRIVCGRGIPSRHSCRPRSTICWAVNANRNVVGASANRRRSTRDGGGEWRGRVGCWRGNGGNGYSATASGSAAGPAVSRVDRQWRRRGAGGPNAPRGGRRQRWAGCRQRRDQRSPGARRASPA